MPFKVYLFRVILIVIMMMLANAENAGQGVRPPVQVLKVVPAGAGQLLQQLRVPGSIKPDAA